MSLSDLPWRRRRLDGSVTCYACTAFFCLAVSRSCASRAGRACDCWISRTQSPPFWPAGQLPRASLPPLQVELAPPIGDQVYHVIVLVLGCAPVSPLLPCHRYNRTPARIRLSFGTIFWTGGSLPGTCETRNCMDSILFKPQKCIYFGVSL